MDCVYFLRNPRIGAPRIPRKFHGSCRSISPIAHARPRGGFEPELIRTGSVPGSDSEAVLNDCGEFPHTILDSLMVDAAVTKDQSASFRVSLITNR